MRRLLVASTLFLAGCATRPQPQPVVPAPVVPRPQAPSGLVGVTAAELIQRFGTPALQIREGTSLKLQFRTRTCVLDAYLYPGASGGGMLRVSHVDTRAPSGSDYNQAACISALDASS
jgi:hypothetical protein